MQLSIHKKYKGERSLLEDPEWCYQQIQMAEKYRTNTLVSSNKLQRKKPGWKKNLQTKRHTSHLQCAGLIQKPIWINCVCLCVCVCVCVWGERERERDREGELEWKFEYWLMNYYYRGPDNTTVVMFNKILLFYRYI